MRILVQYEYNKYNYSSSSSQEMTADDGNYQNAIKTGFIKYLKEEIGISDISVNGNKIICNVETDKIIFTITKNDIKYSVK